MNEALTSLLRASIWLAAAFLLLALLRPLLRQLGGAQLLYRAWWLVPVVLLVPLLPFPTAMVEHPGIVTAGTALAVPAVGQDAYAWSPYVLAVWLAGAMFMLIRGIRAQRRFQNALGALHPRHDGSWQAETDAGLPALVGLLRPRIVVGPGFDAMFSPAQRDLILQHEHNHRRHADHWANAVCFIVRSAFWFHPLMPWALRRFRLDQELACDARTVDPHPTLRRVYADALLKTQFAATAAPMACHLGGSHPLKERIVMLKQSRKGAVVRWSGQIVFAGACALMGTAAWASGSTSSGAPSGGVTSAVTSAVPPSGLEPYAWANADAAVTGGDTPAQAEHMAPPVYPALAKELDVSGQVMIRLTVGVDGRAENVRVEKAMPEGVFEEVAVSAARGWTFRPATQNGHPVASDLRIPVTFSMDAPSTDAPH